MPTSTNLLRIGLPTLTKSEEGRIIDHLLNHPNKEELTFNEALSFACQLLVDIVKANYQYDMSCVQTAWFYGNANAHRCLVRMSTVRTLDLLLAHPDVPVGYSHWFANETPSVIKDSVYFQQCQLKNLVQTHCK